MYNHYQTVTLTNLAMTSNYSERQIIRLLKKHTGKNFSELLLEIRMKKAITLLKNPKLSLTDIHKLLGYSSNNYFRKLFISTFSFTPEDFRNSYQKRMQTFTQN